MRSSRFSLRLGHVDIVRYGELLFIVEGEEVGQLGSLSWYGLF
jgi:hypothetical protein